MAQNISQWSATGTYSDSSTQDVTSQVAWTVSDTSIATIGSSTGVVTIANAGKIWGANVGVTATLAPGTPGTGTIMVIASDSGSVAPRMPQQNDHWQALGLSPWGTWWGMQETTGNLVGSGSTSLTLQASQTAPGQAHTGWTRTEQIVNGSTNFIRLLSGTGPDASTQSIGFLLYAHPSGVVSSIPETIFGFVGSGSLSTNESRTVVKGRTAGRGYNLAINNPAGSSKVFPALGPFPASYDRIHPFLLIIDRTNSRVLLATDSVVCLSSSAETITTDGAKYFADAMSASLVYCAMATGSIVENLATYSASADFLTRLGWNVTWAGTVPTDSSSIKLPFLPYHWSNLGYSPWTATWNLQIDPNAQFGINTNYASNDVWPTKDCNLWDNGVTIGNVGELVNGIPLSGWNRNALFISSSLGSSLNSNASIMMPGLTAGAVSNVLFNLTSSFAMITYVKCTSTMKYGTLFGRTAYGDTSIEGSGGLNTWIGTGPSTSMILYCSGSTTTGSQSIQDGRVHPLLLVYDTTNSRVKAYSDLEAVTGTFHAFTIKTSTTASIFLGAACQHNAGTGQNAGWCVAASGNFVWTAMCTGSTAEAFSDNGKASKFLKDLGWTVSW